MNAAPQRGTAPGVPDRDGEHGAPVPEEARETISRGPIVVALGASAGGLEAFEKFFDRMAPDSAMAFVLVQHLNPEQPSHLSELIAKHTRMPVLQARDGQQVEPDHVYVTPPNASLTIEAGRLKLVSPMGFAHRRTPIDHFFASLAVDQGPNAVCIVLSGAGSDGTIGLRQVKEHGGLTIAQDAGARFASMPQSTLPTGFVDLVLPVEEMPRVLVEHARLMEGLQRRRADGDLDQGTLRSLPRIIGAVKRRTGHDFSQYRQKTIVRRVQRRMVVLHIDSAEKYADRLVQDPEEAERLFKELLIGVTHFFRDPEAFKALEREVVPAIFDGRSAEDEVRVWVPACATGEETYSIAILLREEMDRRRLTSPARIFGGDIDDEGLDGARRGRYPESIAQHLSPERLERFFTRHGPYYQVNKDIRELCIFSTHNLIKNPPYSRLDLISCRNFMIYLDTPLQERLLPLFHYALRPKGFLFLGPSESLGRSDGLFRVVDKKHRLFQRRDSFPAPTFSFPLMEHTSSPPARPAPALSEARPEEKVGRALERHLLSHFAPPSVLVNRRGDILYISGRTGRFLEPAAGESQTPHNIVSMARPGLRLELRAALFKASKAGAEAVQRNVAVEGNGGTHAVTVTVRALADGTGGVGGESGQKDAELFIVIFEEMPAKALQPGGMLPTHGGASLAHGADSLTRGGASPTHAGKSPTRGGKAPKGETGPPSRENDRLLHALESELEATRERLQATVEQLEASNEELKSSNEELVSMNEEMQSANEELQTSKEELQSLNEELETVNTELSKKVDELAAANADIENIFTSTRIATVFVDRQLRVKRFTPTAIDLLNLIDSDIGRPFSDISARFPDGDLLPEIKHVLNALVHKERQVRVRQTGKVYALRIMPYRVGHVIDGVAITFQDVTDIARARESAELLASIVESSNDAIVSKTLEGVITSWNPGAERMFGYTRDEAVGRHITLIVPHDLHGEEKRILERLARGEKIEHYETVRVTKQGKTLMVALTISPLRDATGKITGASKVARDITAQKRAEEELRAHRDRLDALVKERTAELERSQEYLRLSERMAALGTLSAGLGHDMGNLLMPIRVRLESIQGSGGEGSTGEDLTAIRQCVDQLQHLATGLRLLATDPETGLTGQSVKIDEWWQEVSSLFHHIAPKGVTLTARLPEDLPALPLAKHQLTQAIFNLVQNAADAVGSRGHGRITIFAARENEQVQIGVTDDGPGMTEEVKRRCLEPFYSSKARGISTGLGLVFVQGVARQAGGELRFESQPGRGSTFILLFPPARDAQGQGVGQRPALVTLADGRTRGYVQTILRSLGYEPSVEEDHGHAHLWVAERDEKAAEQARLFVGSSPGRVVVLVGQRARRGAGQIPAGPSDERIIEVEPKLAAIRRALQRAADTHRRGAAP